MGWLEDQETPGKQGVKFVEKAAPKKRIRKAPAKKKATK
jgi:hypothetical protein